VAGVPGAATGHPSAGYGYGGGHTTVHHVAPAVGPAPGAYGGTPGPAPVPINVDRRIGATPAANKAQIRSEAAREHSRLATFCTPLDDVGLITALCQSCGISCCQSPPSGGERTLTIKSEFGTGTLLYFRYVQFLIMINTVLAAMAAAQYALAASTGSGLDPTGVYTGVARYFVAAFPTGSRTAWFAFGALQVLLAIAAGPCFWLIGSRYAQRWKGENRVDESMGSTDDPIPENASIGEGSRAVRRTVSIVVFLGIVVGQAFLMLWLHRVLSSTGDSTTAIIISFVIPSLNVVWKIVSKKLTGLEAHRTKSAASEWDTIKVFVVKVANILTLYAVKAIVAAEAGRDPAADSASCPSADSTVDCRCPLGGMAYQFFWLLVSDVTFGLLMEIALPAATLCATRRLGFGKGKGDRELRPEFELSEEFVQLLYRQLMIYLGSSVLPLAPVIGLVATVLSLWLDKYRLVTVCQKPDIKQRPVRPSVLMACHILVALAAVVSYPNGIAVIFSGAGINGVCRFWAD